MSCCLLPTKYLFFSGTETNGTPISLKVLKEEKLLVHHGSCNFLVSAKTSFLVRCHATEKFDSADKYLTKWLVKTPLPACVSSKDALCGAQAKPMNTSRRDALGGLHVSMGGASSLAERQQSRTNTSLQCGFTSGLILWIRSLSLITSSSPCLLG